MTTIHEYSHPLADTAEAFGAALDQHPHIIDMIHDEIDKLDLIERDGQHAPPGESKVYVPSFGAAFGAEDREHYEGAD